MRREDQTDTASRSAVGSHGVAANLEMDRERSANLRRRLAVSSVFFTNGAILASWVPHIPAVKRAHGLGDAALGAILLSMAFGAVSALSISGWLVARFGSRRVTGLAAVGLCLALPLPLLAPNATALAAALFLLGACNGALDVSMNSQAVEVEKLHGRPIMSSFHGLFSLGGLVGAGLAALIEWLGVGARTHVGAATGAGLLVVAMAVPSLVSARAGDGAGPLFVRPTGVLRSLGLLAFAALLAEGSMADWSAVYLRDSLGSTMHLAAIGFAAFSLTMAIGRLTGDAVIRRFGSDQVLRASAMLAAVGLAVALIIGAPAAGIAACAAVGLGVANIFPILLSQAGRLEGVEPSLALAAVTATGYFGFLAGPPLIGAAAELTSLPLALGIVVAFCALIAAHPAFGKPKSLASNVAVEASQ